MKLDSLCIGSLNEGLTVYMVEFIHFFTEIRKRTYSLRVERRYNEIIFSLNNISFHWKL